MNKIKEILGNRQILVLIISILFVAVGSTFAWYIWNNFDKTDVSLTVGNIAEIKYYGGQDVSNNNMGPVLDYNDGEIVSFSVGKRSNKPVYITTYVIPTVIPEALRDESFKCLLLTSTDNRNWTETSEINFIGKVANNKYILVDSDEVTTGMKYYKVIFYIDGNMLNPTDMQGKSFSATVEVAVNEGKANAPELAEGMIPIKYDETNDTWVKANIENINYDWYDYDNKKWANAVMISGKSLIDQSGNNNNGIIYGNPAVTDNEMTFDGVDDYIDVGFENHDFEDNVTIITRIKIDNTFGTGDTNYKYIMGNWERSGIGLAIYNDKLSFDVYSLDKNAWTTTPGVSYSLDTWYTVVGRYNGSEVSLWLDGTKVKSASLTGNIKISIAPIIIGANADALSAWIGKYFNGEMSDAILFDRALSDSEIQNLYVNDQINITDTTDMLYRYSVNNTKISNMREIYRTADVETVIPENDILAHYVWIPRYKYQLFNVESNVATYSGTTCTANCPQEIKINFQKVTDTITNGTTNDEWLTHPAFWWDDDSDGVREQGEELAGIWVGKFETTGYTENPTIKPNLNAIVNQKVSSQFITSQKFNTTNYLTSTDIASFDSHMMKNMEWGSVAYLTYSKYGRCTNGVCEQVRRNNNLNIITGYSAVHEATTGYNKTSIETNEFGTLPDITQPYNTEIGLLASTTKNIYGIYDMVGGAWENVMSNLNNRSGYTAISYTVEQAATILGRTDNKAVGIQNSGYIGPVLGKDLDGTTSLSWTAENGGIPFPDSKYYDLYTASSISNRKLGDATGEVARWFNGDIFVPTNANPWLDRGDGYKNGTGATIFAMSYNPGYSTNHAFRSVLIKK